MEVRKTTGIRTTSNKLMTNLNAGDRFESEMNKLLGSALRKYDDRDVGLKILSISADSE